MVGTKKSAVSLLAATMVLGGLLAACSSKKDNTPAASSTSPGASKSSAAPTAAPEGPKKISFLLVNPTVPDFNSVSQTKDNVYVKQLQKLTGYELSYEFLPGGEETNKQLAVRFASGDLPDVIRTDGISAPVNAGAVDQGAFTDLTPLLDKYAPNLKKAIPDAVWKSPLVSKNGKIYGIPSMWPNPDTRLIYYRKDWMKEAGMNEPTTNDEWLKFFEWVKNNKKDAVGFAYREQMSYSELFFGSFGVHPTMWVMKDGQFVPSMITPGMKDAVKFWKDMYDKGYVNKNMFTNKAADWDNMISTGKAGAWLHDAANYSGWAKKVAGDENNTSVIGLAAAPKGPGGDFLRGKKSGIYYVSVIPSKVKNPEMILKYFDMAYTNQQLQDFFHFGIEGTNYKKTDGKVSFDGLDKAYAKLPSNESQIFTLLLNPRGVGYEDKEVLALSPVGSVIADGFAKASKSAGKDESLDLPAFDIIKEKPELAASAATGTLFADMFAKAITGKESVDQAFDSFVAEWKKRGGDSMIKIATDWHKSFYGN
ncbi:MAG: extracellular solute-binding protein [Paenibacillaceae bacterium]|nr:extracellular solute-binding protein [Paenibacillaceae bacterium]